VAVAELLRVAWRTVGRMLTRVAEETGANLDRLEGLGRIGLRAKVSALEEALRGFFTDHHAAILQMMLDNIDRHSEQIAALDTTLEAAVAPFAQQVAQLDEITGVGVTAAQELIAEVGVDMGRFPSHAHLVSWGQVLPPGPRVGRQEETQGSRQGQPVAGRDAGNIVAAAARTDSFLGARSRRIAKRRGKQKAIVAVGNSVPVIVYHLLGDPEAQFHDLGAEHYEVRIDKQRRAQPRRPAPSRHRPAHRDPRGQGRHRPTRGRLTIPNPRTPSNTADGSPSSAQAILYFRVRRRPIASDRGEQLHPRSHPSTPH
jgi:hypothetical protein